MRKLFLLIIILTGLKVNASADSIDSLKQHLQETTNDTVKAEIYLKMAKAYLELKAPNHVYRERNGENAVNYTMLALHLYSKMDDTTGIRNSYTSLAKGYRMQKQYTQAKWFLIQSSILAKGQKDMPNMIASLIELANIKIETGDYILAKKDLSYALRLTSKYNVPDYQTTIIQNIAIVDNNIKNLPDDKELKDMKELSAGKSTIVTGTQAIAPVVNDKTTVKVARNRTKGKVVKTTTGVRKNVKLTVAADNFAAL